MSSVGLDFVELYGHALYTPSGRDETVTLESQADVRLTVTDRSALNADSRFRERDSGSL
jgi:hypothetical protein